MKQGKLAAGSNTDIARGMIGAGVAKGAPKPDISSEAAFKAALLNAKSIAVTDPAGGGGSGVYFGKLFEQMGLAAIAQAQAEARGRRAERLRRRRSSPKARPSSRCSRSRS